MYRGLFSIWQGVPGTEAERTRSREAVCDESSQEGIDRPEDENDRAHQDRETSAGGNQRCAVSHHPSLRFPDRRKTSPHSRYMFLSISIALSRIFSAYGWLEKIYGRFFS